MPVYMHSMKRIYNYINKAFHNVKGVISLNRITETREQMKKQNIDALLISSQSNVYYVSGFFAEEGVAVILLTQDHAILMSDGRFMSDAAEQSEGFVIQRWKRDMFSDMGELLDALALKKVWIDGDDVSYAQVQILQSQPAAQIAEAPKLLEKLRAIKGEHELSEIRTACRIADEAFAEILKFLRPGITEQDVCNELEFQLRKRGAATCSFEMIIASGKRGALPHGVATDKVIQTGDMVTMDFGALYHHYRSDITRTVAIGEPAAELKKIYNIVKEAQQIGRTCLKAGVRSCDLEHNIRSFIESSGYDLIHGPGHSFGLDIHEAPFISRTNMEVFCEGTVITLEPGIYVPGLGGVRIEDDFLITRDGCEALTHAERELIILPFS